MSLSVYDIDFIDLANKLNVPKLRQTKFTAFMNVVMNQLTWNHNRFFEDYTDGAVYANWSNVTVYMFGDIVLYRDALNNKKVYLCVDTATLGIAGVLPTNTASWLLLMDDFVGADERRTFTNQKLVLEWILNRYFETTFRQPPTASDIYITNTGNSDRFWNFTMPTAWNSGTTYGLNAVISYAGNVWISIQAGNLNHLPNNSIGWWELEPSQITRYISTTAYAAATMVRNGYFYFISLQSTTGNAPPNTGGATAFWKQVNNIWVYEAGKTYAIGDVVNYNSDVYMCILATTGHAPPNATYWLLLTNARSSSITDCGFNIYIPVAVYNSFGGSYTHPNKCDETIFKLVRRYWDAFQFRIITY